MKAPNLWRINSLLDNLKSVSTQIDGHYYPARPIGLDTLSHRVKLAWGVFAGKYDALKWPKNQ